MRDLNSEWGLSLPVTAPRYLIELDMSELLTLRYSTFGTVNWDDQEWIGGAAVRSIESYQSAMIELQNADYALTPIMITGQWRGRSCRIWAVSINNDPLLIFAGQMSAGTVDVRVNISCTSQGLKTIFTPSFRIEPPVFRHLPPAGTVVEWDDEIFVLEREQ